VRFTRHVHDRDRDPCTGIDVGDDRRLEGRHRRARDDVLRGVAGAQRRLRALVEIVIGAVAAIRIGAAAPPLDDREPERRDGHDQPEEQRDEQPGHL